MLWFLALDNALINSDGYWTRASDYSIFRDEQGKFHIIPHDTNETFGPAMMFGPPGGFGGRRPRRASAVGGGGGRGGRRAAADRADRAAAGGPGGRRRAAAGGRRPRSLVGLDDARKPLRSRLLAVPGLKARYLEHVRTIAEDWLDWNKLGPVVARYRALIEKEVEADTRKLTSLAAFQKAVADDARGPGGSARRGRGPAMSLRASPNDGGSTS